jgi:hypothetical protein
MAYAFLGFNKRVPKRSEAAEAQRLNFAPNQNVGAGSNRKSLSTFSELAPARNPEYF